jgi:hypothetical protein
LNILVKQDFFCFGCLDESEKIWTSTGLKPIGEVLVGDVVFDINANFSKVVAVSRKNKKVSKLSIRSFRDGLLITEDHVCFVLKKSSVDRRDLRNLSFELCEFSRIEEGDYIPFPIIYSKNRNKDSLKIVSKSSFSDVIKGVALPCSVQMACFYGAYLSSGSIDLETMEISVLANEKNAYRISKSIKSFVNLSVKVEKRNDFFRVSFISADIAYQLLHYFGNHNTKNVPINILFWPSDVQRSIAECYSECLSPSVKSSDNVSFGIYCLAIQSGMTNIVLDNSVFQITKEDGGFYGYVGENLYYFSEVFSIERNVHDASVIDISVEKSESFTTKMGAVHNCKASGNIINLVSCFEQISLSDSINKLSSGLNISVDGIIDSIIRDIINSTNEIDQISKEDSMLAIYLFVCVHMHDFLKKVNFDSAEMEIAEKVFSILDGLVSIKNLQGLQELAEYIPDKTKYRYEKYIEEKSKKEIEKIKNQRGIIDEV